MHLCSLGWQLVFIAKWNQPYYPPVNHNTVGHLKDTATNLKSGQGFAMNIISEAFIENANETAVDTPPEFDEWALSGLTKEKCVHVHLHHKIYGLTIMRLCYSKQFKSSLMINI
ncbi:uncharacterized protein F5891DRAFT_621249 [Suillus fuscotomentosus]|uniref:Uncharacterized protein n=1 Tax=Suillus fuscotomentosus TaxID=1912939 RepID=A0AAD4EGI9_9AGAM|nr:uncharacterized protein F5891DRAFT_621249 [Suillus fuscotomentosus]KAG1905661.1 hypothetical protein F5891DRAFT_621249 [Suillus fuscotomentosus]